MFATEKAFLAATNLTGFDALAQRAMRLRKELRSLVDFAVGNNAAVLACVNAACALGVVLNAAHMNRSYGFLRGTKVVRDDNADTANPFADLYEVAGTMSEADAQETLAACSQVADEVRSSVPSVAITMNGRPCFYILHGDLYERAQHYAQPAANAA